MFFIGISRRESRRDNVPEGKLHGNTVEVSTRELSRPGLATYIDRRDAIRRSARQWSRNLSNGIIGGGVVSSSKYKTGSVYLIQKSEKEAKNKRGSPLAVEFAALVI